MMRDVARAVLATLMLAVLPVGAGADPLSAMAGIKAGQLIALGVTSRAPEAWMTD
jgi:hypothetical protein